MHESWLGSAPEMARSAYVSAPPASSMTVTAGQRAQANRRVDAHAKSCLIPETSANTPARRQGPGGSLPGAGRGPSPVKCRRSRRQVVFLWFFMTLICLTIFNITIPDTIASLYTNAAACPLQR